MTAGPATNNRTPRFTVTVAGQTVTQADPKGLESISVEDHVDMIGVCELSFARGSSASGIQWASLTVGADVEVVFGGDTRPVFKGKITAIRHGSNRGRDVAVVQAMDPLIQLSMSRRTKSFERTKDSDAANDAISASGGIPGRVDATTEVRAHIHQRNESNLTFIRRLAARNGYLVYCNEGKVDFTKLQSSATALPIPAAEMISLDYDMSPKSIPPSITVYGWDYVNKQRVEGRATPSDVELIGGGQSSAENRGDIWGQDAFISDVWVDSQSAAKEHAVAEYNRLARSFLRGSATMQCNGSLHVGVKVRFEEHRTGFNPEAFVMSSRHRVYVGGGATTEITFCSNTREATAAGGGESGAGVGSALASGTPMPSGPASPMTTALGGSAFGGIAGALGGAGGALGGAGGALGGVAAAAGGALHQAQAAASQAASGARAAIGSAAGAIGAAAETAIGAVPGTIPGAAGAAGAAQGAVSGALQQGVGAANDAIGGAQAQLDTAFSSAGSEVGRIVSGIPGMPGGSAGSSGSSGGGASAPGARPAGGAGAAGAEPAGGSQPAVGAPRGGGGEPSAAGGGGGSQPAGAAPRGAGGAPDAEAGAQGSGGAGARPSDEGRPPGGEARAEEPAGGAPSGGAARGEGGGGRAASGEGGAPASSGGGEDQGGAPLPGGGARPPGGGRGDGGGAEGGGDRGAARADAGPTAGGPVRIPRVRGLPTERAPARPADAPPGDDEPGGGGKPGGAS